MYILPSAEVGECPSHVGVDGRILIPLGAFTFFVQAVPWVGRLDVYFGPKGVSLLLNYDVEERHGVADTVFDGESRSEASWRRSLSRSASFLSSF